MAYIGNNKTLFAPRLIVINSNDYNILWDAIQKSGARTIYDRVFEGWTPESFRPKYSMNVTSAVQMFENFTGEIDLVERLNECGVSLDFSRCSNFEKAFNMSAIKRIGDLDLRKATNTAYLFHCGSIETIENLIVDNNFWPKGTEFKYCPHLQNISITGLFHNNGLDFHWSGLTHQSLLNIINALASYVWSGGMETRTITLGVSNLSKLTNAEIAMATEKGWTLV